MDPTDQAATPGVEGDGPTIKSAIEQYLGAQDSGVYVANSKPILETFEKWATSRCTHIDELDKKILTQWAVRLRRRVDADAITPATARNYFDVVAAMLTYCVRRDWLATNPARKEAPMQELPAVDRSRSEQQFWTPQNREEIVRWADWRAEDALDHGWMDGAVAVRDRALVAVFAYSGVRGAEVLADPRDDDRDGLRWRDVSLVDGSLTVTGKGGETQHAPLPKKAQEFLRLHKRRQQPASDAWTVFRTRHLPSLYDGVPDGLDVECSPGTVLDIYREHDLAPPALSTNGGRSIVRRLSEESGIRGSDGDVLKPHAARRGLGDELYRSNPELAQQALRHQSIDVTHQSYRHVQVSEVTEDIDDIL